MISLLVITIVLSLVGAFCCSITEAALYAVPLPHVKYLAESGSRSGKILLKFKEDMSRPVAAILILNTLANTTGAAIAGALVQQSFGEQGLLVFSVVFTLVLLYLSEIMPKVAGIAYCKSLSTIVAVPLALAITILAPMIWFGQKISQVFKLDGDSEAPSVSTEEVLSMAAIGREEGALDHFEGSVIANVIALDRLLVKDLLTPRVVVFRAKENLTLGDIEGELPNWVHTRVPLYSEADPDLLTGYVRQRDLYREILRGNKSITLKELARPLKTVPELMRADRLLFQLFEEAEHVCAVVDERGALAGIITLEDVIEEIVGRDIVDEYDKIPDVRSVAKVLRGGKFHQKGEQQKKEK